MNSSTLLCVKYESKDAKGWACMKIHDLERDVNKRKTRITEVSIKLCMSLGVSQVGQ